MTEVSLQECLMCEISQVLQGWQYCVGQLYRRFLLCLLVFLFTTNSERNPHFVV